MNHPVPSYLPSGLLIGVPEIDAQHDRLFAQLAMFRRLCLERNAFLPEDGEALYAALAEHCATEERLAACAGIDFQTHGKKHNVMLRGIRKALDYMEYPESDVFALIRYLEYWFERHIKQEDMLLGAGLSRAAQSRLADGVALPAKVARQAAPSASPPA